MSDTYIFTKEQLAIFIRGTIGMANEFYEMKGLGNDEEVYRMTIAQQFLGLESERELVRRGFLAKPEFQVLPE